VTSPVDSKAIERLVAYAGGSDFDLDELTSFFGIFAMYPEYVDVPGVWSDIAEIATHDVTRQRLRDKRLEGLTLDTRR
jgi:hypothetical protein